MADQNTRLDRNVARDKRGAGQERIQDFLQVLGALCDFLRHAVRDALTNLLAILHRIQHGYPRGESSHVYLLPIGSFGTFDAT